MNSPIRLNVDAYNAGYVAEMVYFKQADDHNYNYYAKLDIPFLVPPASLVPEDFNVWSHRHGGTSDGLYAHRLGYATISVEIFTRKSSVVITGISPEVVGALWEEITNKAKEQYNPNIISTRMWSAASGGPSYDAHDIDPLLWADVRRNYADSVVTEMDKLVVQEENSHRRGNLILWYGPAGTGKTTAVTSLLTEWAPWCEAHLVTDPEQLFADPNYLLQVSNTNSRGRFGDPMPSLDSIPSTNWKIIVCEDADEYLRTDARQRSGAALGRLLNLTDGIMGRGAKTMVLLTTNDELGRLHPAVTRPGRCQLALEFPPLNVDEVQRWCGDLKPPRKPMTLAELYAYQFNNEVPEEEVNTGVYL